MFKDNKKHEFKSVWTSRVSSPKKKLTLSDCHASWKSCIIYWHYFFFRFFYIVSICIFISICFFFFYSNSTISPMNDNLNRFTFISYSIHIQFWVNSFLWVLPNSTIQTEDRSTWQKKSLLDDVLILIKYTNSSLVDNLQNHFFMADWNI